MKEVLMKECSMKMSPKEALQKLEYVAAMFNCNKTDRIILDCAVEVLAQCLPAEVEAPAEEVAAPAEVEAPAEELAQ